MVPMLTDIPCTLTLGGETPLGLVSSLWYVPLVPANLTSCLTPHLSGERLR